MVWALLNDSQNTALKELIRLEESDRVVAIVGGAMLDDSIRRALEARLRAKDGNTDMNEKLFKIGQALGNLGPKIDLGYQLYMLDKTETRCTAYQKFGTCLLIISIWRFLMKTKS